MLIERPPKLFRALFPKALFRIKDNDRKEVYLTFDDGPIPEVTPWVLDVLQHYDIKATFFMVGDNVKLHPELRLEVEKRGHAVGNHTMHHLQGCRCSLRHYMKDVLEAHSLIGSGLFRPPHGWLRSSQAKALQKHFRIIMYDLVTRDYSRHLSPDQVTANVRRLARPGAIIVFHDSIKSWPRLQKALPQSIEWLLSQGYEFKTLSR